MAETDQPDVQHEYLSNWFIKNAPNWQKGFLEKARAVLDKDFASNGIGLAIEPGFGTDQNSHRLELQGPMGEKLEAAKTAINKLITDARK